MLGFKRINVCLGAGTSIGLISLILGLIRPIEVPAEGTQSSHLEFC